MWQNSTYLDLITTYLHLPITDPTWIFIVVLCVILFAPMVLSKLHIPHLIGMILAGVLIGENGLNLLARDASFELFGKVGIYFIMFLAGLEMDMQNLKQNYSRGILFGVITTIIPFTFGFIAGYWFLHYTAAASLLLACILASHTLVSYTIVGKYGLSKNPAVTISVVATMVALLLSLLTLAGLSGVITGKSGVWYWGWFVAKFIIYIAILFGGLPKVIRIFFKKFTEPIMQFTFALVCVFISAAIAELCGLEGILGAFLSGLVLNRFIPLTSPLMNRLEFVGNALFIPYFLIGVGMLVNVEPLLHDVKAVVVVIVMVVAGTLSKYLAAHITQYILGFSRKQGTMMFGLTEAHAAGALAMVMVGTKLQLKPGIPLMDNAVLDGVVMMILISCIISSFATEHAARRLKLEEKKQRSKNGERRDSTALDDEKILIPIHETSNIPTLMNAAFMMRNRKLKRGLICLSIINDADVNEQTQAHSRECLALASKIAAAADVPVQTQTRLAVNFVTAAIHSLKENDASEVLIGLHKKRKPNDSFFGQFAQGLIDGMPRQLMIVNFKIPSNTIRKIVVVVPEKAEYEKGFTRWINRIARMAEDLGCRCEFHATESASQLIASYMGSRHGSVRAEYVTMSAWSEFQQLSSQIENDHLLVVIASRRTGISYQKQMNKLPMILQNDFSHCSLMVVYPDIQEETFDNYFSIQKMI